MRIKLISFMLILLFLILPHPIQAQFSLKPKPLPDCKTFLISEIGYLYRVNSPSAEDLKYRHYFVSNFGLMKNLIDKWAVGATTHVGVDTDVNIRGGLKVRVRRWLSEENSLDLSLGITLVNSRDDKNPSFSGSIGYSIRDILIIEVLTEIATHYTYPHSPDQVWSRAEETDIALYIGIKTGSGSKPGFIVNTAVVVLGAAFGIAYGFAGGD